MKINYPWRSMFLAPNLGRVPMNIVEVLDELEALFPATFSRTSMLSGDEQLGWWLGDAVQQGLLQEEEVRNLFKMLREHSALPRS